MPRTRALCLGGPARVREARWLLCAQPVVGRGVLTYKVCSAFRHTIDVMGGHACNPRVGGRFDLAARHRPRLTLCRTCHGSGAATIGNGMVLGRAQTGSCPAPPAAAPRRKTLHRRMLHDVVSRADRAPMPGPCIRPRERRGGGPPEGFQPDPPQKGWRVAVKRSDGLTR